MRRGGHEKGARNMKMREVRSGGHEKEEDEEGEGATMEARNGGGKKERGKGETRSRGQEEGN